MTVPQHEVILATINQLEPFREQIGPHLHKQEALRQTHTAHLTSAYALARDSKKAGDESEIAKAAEIEEICAAALGEAVESQTTTASSEALRTKEMGLAAAAKRTDEKAAAVKMLIDAERDKISEIARAGLADFRAKQQAVAMAALELFISSAHDMMAADYLTNKLFEDSKAPTRWYQGPEALFGPAGVMVERIRQLDWDTWPYSLRPGWAHKNGDPAWKHADVSGKQIELRHALGLKDFR